MHSSSFSSSRRFFPRSVLLALGAMCALILSVAQLHAAAATDLFASDLSNATQQGPWQFEDGVLVAKDHGALWTKKTYKNFILDLDFKVTKESNSGVFLHCGDINNAIAALEIQVHESTDGTKFGMVGALYDCKAPSKNVAKPTGEWNHYTITFRGSKLTVVFNGEQVIAADLNDWPTKKLNPDGTPNKFPLALKDWYKEGPIGLQGLHGKAAAPVWYRNLKIQSLD